MDKLTVKADGTIIVRFVNLSANQKCADCGNDVGYLKLAALIVRPPGAENGGEDWTNGGDVECQKCSPELP